MSNLYEFIKSDLPETIEKLIGSIEKKLFVQPGWRADIAQECYAIWLSTKYEPHYTRSQILSYAYRCALMKCLEWRRKTVLVVTLSGVIRPEPIGIHWEYLMGEDKERFIDETTTDEMNPEHFFTQPIKAVEQGEELSLKDVRYPSDDKNKKKYQLIVQELANGLTYKEIANIVGVTDRTIYRRVNEVIKENENHRI